MAGLLWLFWLMSQAAAPPVIKQFDRISVREGLSNNSVHCMLQDREGFMWFGTNDGLNKYDGYTFTVFQPDPNNPARSLQNNRILALREDRKNRLWAVTQGGGLHEINKQTGQVTPHPIQARNAHRWNNQVAIYEDRAGYLWVSTFNGLARYEPDRHHFVLYPVPQVDMQVKTVFEDRQSRLWVGTSYGLFQLSRETGKYTLVPWTEDAQQPVVNAFCLDKNDRLWLGSMGQGLLELDLNDPAPRPRRFNPGNRISPYVFLNAVHCDDQGNVWVGTTEGLHQVDPVQQRVVTYSTGSGSKNDLSSASAQAIYHDRAGTLWVATNNGINRQTTSAKPFVTYQVKPGLGETSLLANRVSALLLDARNQLWISNHYDVYRKDAAQPARQISPDRLRSSPQSLNYVLNFLPDGTKGIWLGSTKGILQFDNATNNYTLYPSDIWVQLMSRHGSGPIWIGGDGGIAAFDPVTKQYTYYKYDPANPVGIPDRFVYALLASRSGHVWVAVNGKGISRLDPKTGRFTHYLASTTPGHLNNSEVLTFFEDQSGVLWVGTNQGGLNRFDPQTGRFSYVTTRDGLPSNRIVGIQSDKEGRLWLSTNRGLCRYDPRKHTVQNYTMSNGLPSNDFLENAVLRQQNRLYFGTQNGLVHFNTDSIRADMRPFPVYITGFKVLDNSRPVTTSVTELRYNENFLAFEFVALTYVLPEQCRYAYQLVGVDKDWVQSGNRRFANYPNLDPGTYTFQVKAANSDGVWAAKPAVFQIVIRPPWWQTWWAYLLYALVIVAAVYAYLRDQTRRIRQQQKAEQLKKLDEIKTRLFTNITHEFRTPLSLIISPVQQLLGDNQLDADANRKLGLIQRNARQLLRLINQVLDLSKLETNLMTVALQRGDVQEYVGLLVDTFSSATEQKGVALTYRASVGEREWLFDADKWEKILTNLLANALKFTEQEGKITVTLAVEGVAGTPAEAHITISDTGIGISPTYLPHIFDRFYQVDDSATRAYGGTGIGLALVKELTELIGGTIQVSSELGVGTTFKLRLPILVPTGAEEPVSTMLDPATKIPDVPYGEISRQTAVETGPLILVVEDSTDLREFIVSELSNQYRVISADNGLDGWELVQAELPDVVISDVMMPRMSGIELTERIKTTPLTAHIAVLLLTARTAHDSVMDGLQKGANEYMAKPFNLEELEVRLRNMLTQQQRLREQFRTQLTLIDSPEERQEPEDDFLKRVYAILEKALDSSISVTSLAQQLDTTPRTLNRKLDSLVQLSSADVIRQYKLRRAGELLKKGHSITDVTYMTGFKSTSHFSTLFKGLYQKTPTQFLDTE
ncbi:two-component regulator propeller domain-containing protein [Spirosoma sp. KUDC1026]|uniref:hybrid sensor histidine kinase/response regulator transcription factor n=1 Tax=Spirosoma sp. KUDC1026 TaxID=2745947 RepID=UPI00159BE37E|nr:two-component regulator propeller domain-containing protein [Spirosoma sp. KUDC1026]QKZ13803.1 response regulator [Spirosoma sp. KUDC1026]